MSNQPFFTLDKAQIQEVAQEAVQEATKMFQLNLAQEQSVFLREELEVDKKTIEEFIDFAYGYAEADKYIAFRSFSESGQAHQQPIVKWVANDENAHEQIAQYAQEAAIAGMSAFVIPALMPNGLAKASDVKGQCVLVVDIDDGDIKAKLDHVTEHVGLPSMVVQSGGKTIDGVDKYHLYYRLDEEAYEEDELSNIGKLQHRIAVQCGCDTSFGSLHQPLRLPGSWHQKKAPRLVSIIAKNDREYSLEDIINAVMDIPSFGSDGNSAFDLSQASAAKSPIEQVLVKDVHAGGEGEETRFTALSRVIGHLLSQVWEGRLSNEMAWDKLCGHNELYVHPPWPEARLRDEYNRLYKKRRQENGAERVFVEAVQETLLGGFSFGELYKDDTPFPPDLIERILGQGAKMIFAGAPKAMKSMIWQYMAERAALGKDVLGQPTARPLRIAYIQAEMTRDQMRRRVKLRKYTNDEVEKLSQNMWISDKFRFSLDQDGIDLCIRSIRTKFPDGVDIIAFDPLVNLFHGDMNENDNGKVMGFLRDCVERVQIECDPNAALVLLHHSAKKKYEDLVEDPFSVIRGASAIRGWYDQGIVVSRKNATEHTRVMFFENRAEQELPMKEIELNFATGCFDELTNDFKPENLPKNDAMSIEQILIDASREDKFFTPSQFGKEYAGLFEGKSHETLRRDVEKRLEAGEFKGFDGASKGLTIPRKNSYFVWCEGMILDTVEADDLNDAGERYFVDRYIDYTHYKKNGAWIPREPK